MRKLSDYPSLNAFLPRFEDNFMVQILFKGLEFANLSKLPTKYFSTDLKMFEML